VDRCARRGNAVKLINKEITFRKSLFLRDRLQRQTCWPARSAACQTGARNASSRPPGEVHRENPATRELGGNRARWRLEFKVTGWIEFDVHVLSLEISGGKVEHMQLEVRCAASGATLRAGGIGCWRNRWTPNTTATGSATRKPVSSYLWEDQRDWVLTGPIVARVSPTDTEAVIRSRLPKEVDLAQPRTITLAGHSHRRSRSGKTKKRMALHQALQTGRGHTPGDYTFATPNYPKPRESKECMRRRRKSWR